MPYDNKNITNTNPVSESIPTDTIKVENVVQPKQDTTGKQAPETKPTIENKVPEPKKGLWGSVLGALNLTPANNKSSADAQSEANSQLIASDATQNLSAEVLTKADPTLSPEDLKKSEQDKLLNNITAQVSKVADPIMEKITGKKIQHTEKLSTEAEKELAEIKKAEGEYNKGLMSVNNIIAPDSMEIAYDHLKISGMYAKTFFVYNYPRYIETNWLAPIINYDATFDISIFIYPMDSAKIMNMLRNKVAQISAQIHINQEKGFVRDPGLEAAFQDAEELRDSLQRGSEKFFHFALYFTVFSDDQKNLSLISKQMQNTLGGRLVLTKPANLQVEHGFNSTLPLASDELGIFRNMNTSPLSSSFPFTSADLTSNDGILYGINRHNDSLIIFDRFKLENANAVIFAKSGAGKSFGIKLEILRSLMLGTDVIVIDPENEFKPLCNTVGGTYLNMSLNSNERINPFDLPQPLKDEITKPGDNLRTAIITLTGLLKLMLGEINPKEEALLDRALINTYTLKGITMDTENPHEKRPPTMIDLYNTLINMTGTESLAQRLQKYTTGTFSGLFSQETNINLNNGLMVFCIRDLEDSLRPIAMYMVLNYIWTQVRSSLRKRLLVVDEAWNIMQYEDSARFMFGLVKRARKYYLGITTITQDVEDFLKSKYGKPIITNSSMQLLLKQSPAAIDAISTTFNLTEGEKYLLLNSGVGQGLFFAGNKHVAIQIIASYTEQQTVTTNPEELLKQQEDKKS